MGEGSARTSAEEFDRWLELIPNDFDLHFIGVRRNGKEPSVDRGDSWKDEEHRIDVARARSRLREGGNVGFVARGDLAVVDVDHEEGARKLLGKGLFDTLSVSTRSGGIHLYFVNCGVVNADVPEVAEVRAEWRYVLVPGSFVPPGSTAGEGLYEVVGARPPAAIFPEDLPPELRSSGAGGGEIVPVFRRPGEDFVNRYGWRLEDVRGEDEKLDDLLGSVEIPGYPSISEADFATCVKLLYWEFDPPTCGEILRTHRSREKVLEREDYVERTLRRAWSRVSETISDRVDPEEWEPGSIFDRITIPGRRGGKRGGGRAGG